MLSVVVVVCAKIHRLEVLCKHFASIFTERRLFRQNTNMSLGERIKKLSDEKGVSNYQISKDTGISQSTLSRLMTNSTSKLNSTNIEILAKYFDVSVDYLRTGNEEKTPKEGVLVEEPHSVYEVKNKIVVDVEQLILGLRETIEAQRETIEAQKKIVEVQQELIIELKKK